MQAIRLLAFGLFSLASVLGAQDLVVRAGKLHTVSGPVIEDGLVVIQAGKIVSVGKADEVVIPAPTRLILEVPELIGKAREEMVALSVYRQ